MNTDRHGSGREGRKGPYIVGLGIACVDYLFVAPAAERGEFSPIVDYKVEGGGLTGTSIVAASRLGARTKMLGRIGDDDVGDQIVEGLEAEGVDASGLIRVPGGKSYFSIIHVDADTAERTIYGREDSDIDCSTDLIALQALEGADALLVDHHWADGSRVAVRRANELGIPVVIDMTLRPDTLDLLAMCDYPVIPRKSALEFARASEYASGRETGPEAYSEAVRKIRSAGRRAAVITCGPEGAYYADENGEGHVEAFSVDAVDTTGAGDVFHGAFALGLTQGWGLADVIRFASAVSAIKCTKVGGRAGIPTFEQVMEFLRERS